jgi:hypothetical protein
MTRLPLVLAVVLASATVAGCGGSNSAASSTTTARPRVRRLTFHVVEHDRSLKQTGNTVTIVNDLLSHGKRIGTGQVDCVLSGRGALALCTGAATLPEGQILSDASLRIPPPVGTSIDAIVGGTGAYATARGTIDLTRHSPGGDTDVTFHVILDA